jgi:hypothetical protein
MEVTIVVAIRLLSEEVFRYEEGIYGVEPQRLGIRGEGYLGIEIGGVSFFKNYNWIFFQLLNFKRRNE